MHPACTFAFTLTNFGFSRYISFRYFSAVGSSFRDIFVHCFSSLHLPSLFLCSWQLISRYFRRLPLFICLSSLHLSLLSSSPLFSSSTSLLPICLSSSHQYPPEMTTNLPRFQRLGRRIHGVNFIWVDQDYLVDTQAPDDMEDVSRF